MTYLLEQAIERLNALPPKRQDDLAGRIIARIEEEQRVERQLLDDLDEGIRAADAGELRDGEEVMAELAAKYAE